MGRKWPFLGAGVWTWNSSPNSMNQNIGATHIYQVLLYWAIFKSSKPHRGGGGRKKKKTNIWMSHLPSSCWWVFTPSRRAWTSTLCPTGRNVAVRAQRLVGLGQKLCQALREPSEHRQGVSCASVPSSCQLAGAEQGRESSGLEGSQWTDAFLNQERLGKELLGGAGDVRLHLSTTSAAPDPFIETQQCGSIIYCL